MEEKTIFSLQELAEGVRYLVERRYPDRRGGISINWVINSGTLHCEVTFTERRSQPKEGK